MQSPQQQALLDTESRLQDIRRHLQSVSDPPSNRDIQKPIITARGVVEQAQITTTTTTVDQALAMTMSVEEMLEAERKAPPELASLQTDAWGGDVA